MITHIGSSIIALPLISILESIAVAKAFGELHLNFIRINHLESVNSWPCFSDIFSAKGRTVDATQEMLALGLCNLFGSFFQSMPVTGSMTRTAVNNASGVRTTLGGIVTGGLVLLSLGFLTGTFKFIPKTTLAGVIICAMIKMVDPKDIKEIWRSKRMFESKNGQMKIFDVSFTSYRSWYHSICVHFNRLSSVFHWVWHHCWDRN